MEDLGAGDVRDQVKRFFSNVETGLRDGASVAADILKAASEKPEEESRADDDEADNVRDVTDED
jgi:hypothetical protein